LILLSQMFTWGVKKCLNLTFNVNFLCQKLFKSFWTCFHRRISIGFCYCHFLKTSIFEKLCFLKWCQIFDGPCEHLWNSNQKIIFILLIFSLKSTPCWLTSAKLHHWGHTNVLLRESRKRKFEKPQKPLICGRSESDRYCHRLQKHDNQIPNSQLPKPK
jgi:hypothetical protein